MQNKILQHQRFRITFLIRLIANKSLIRCQQDRLKDISRGLVLRSQRDQDVAVSVKDDIM